MKKKKEIKNPLRYLKKAIERAEKDWRKEINDEENPMLKMFKQDYKDLIEIESKLIVFEAKYGVKLTLEFPEKPRTFWGKGIKLK